MLSGVQVGWALAEGLQRPFEVVLGGFR